MKRKIPVKNYIYLSVLFIATILISVFLRQIYINSNFNSSSKFLPEVAINELSNYLLENPNIIVYLSHSNDNNKLNKKIEKYLIKNDINKGLIYINLDNITNDDIDNLNKKYLDNSLKDSNKLLRQHNNLFVINDGLITDILYSEESEMNYKKVVEFIENHEVFD